MTHLWILQDGQALRRDALIAHATLDELHDPLEQHAHGRPHDLVEREWQVLALVNRDVSLHSDRKKRKLYRQVLAAVRSKFGLSVPAPQYEPLSTYQPVGEGRLAAGHDFLKVLGGELVRVHVCNGCGGLEVLPWPRKYPP